jgi:hypothetical protein
MKEYCRYDQLSAGAWFTYHGSLHCKDSRPDRGKVLTFDLAGNFKTDAFCIRGEEMVIPVSVTIRIND